MKHYYITEYHIFYSVGVHWIPAVRGTAASNSL